MAIELGLVDRAGANAQSLKNMVGVAGLEPTTPCPPDRCATGLRYTPKKQDNTAWQEGRQVPTKIDAMIEKS